MINNDSMLVFEDKINELPSIDNVALGKVYDVESKVLVGVFPNLSNSYKSLRVFNNFSSEEGVISKQDALDYYCSDIETDFVSENDNGIQFLQTAIKHKVDLMFNPVITKNPNLLELIISGKGRDTHKQEALDLFESGAFKFYEKIYGIGDLRILDEAHDYAVDVFNAIYLSKFKDLK